MTFSDSNFSDRFGMNFRILSILALLVSISGCQTTSPHFGEGDIWLSNSAANIAERYLRDPEGTAFAVGKTGHGTGYVTCPVVRCDFLGGSPESHAIKICESGSRECKILMVRKQIVWRGKVRVKRRTNGSNILTITVPRGASSTSSYTGNAFLDDDAHAGRLVVKVQGKTCRGKYDIERMDWLLRCGKTKYTGNLESNEANRYWGRDVASSWQIKIEPDRHRLLEDAIITHNRSEISLAASTKESADSKTTEKADDDKQLEMTWANVWGTFKGTIDYRQNAAKGTMKFKNDTTALQCNGSFEVWYGTTGSWKLKCGDGSAADGALRVRSGKVSGTGKDKNGSKVKFGPADS